MKAEFMIHINGRANMTWQGGVEHVQSGQVQYFRSDLELWRLIRQKLAETGCPQAARQMRSWSEGVGTIMLEEGEM